MGKLVIYLADGTTMDVPLRKERITIGRRPDNDVCLPFPAVSGEHAQVVTILADSFLEDLGSTNGTIVNGKAVAKHFLVDHDQIDIGRQRLTYLADDNARVAALPPDIVSRQLRGLSERVDGVKAAPRAIVSSGLQAPARQTADVAVADIERDMVEAAAAPDASGEAAAAPVAGVPINPLPAVLRQTERGRAAAPAAGAGMPAAATDATLVAGASPRMPATAGSLAPELMPVPGGGLAASPNHEFAPRDVALAPPSPPAARATPESTPPREAAVPVTSGGAAAAPATATTAPAPMAASGPSVRVLSGASAGRTVAFPGPELSVGRVGVQVALVRKVDGGYLLIPIEGREPPRINGAAVAPEGSTLHPGDTFEVAGVRLELSVQS